MFKRIILTTIFSLSFFIEAEFNAPNPNNTTLAWDLRDVLVERARESKIQIALTVLKNANNKWELIKLMPNYNFWQEIHALGHRPDFCMDEIVEKITEKYPALAPYKNMIVEMMTKHITKDDVVEILKEVKKEGYQNVIASNIGQQSYEHMKQSMPEFFAHFDAVMLAHPGKNKEEKWIAKPQSAYFQKLRAKIGQGKQIVFIDDKQINVDGAHNSEQKIQGIKYDNPDQLREVLVKLGILKNAHKA